MPDTVDHSIYMYGNGAKDCSCGLRFPASDPWGALNHALPLNTRRLADQVAGDAESSPELVASSESLAQRAARLNR